MRAGQPHPRRHLPQGRGRPGALPDDGKQPAARTSGPDRICESHNNNNGSLEYPTCTGPKHLCIL